MPDRDSAPGLDETLLRRIRRKWEGEPGRRLERIDDGRPAGWIEWNARLGRERLRSLIVEWLEPLDGLRVLDAGCGTGMLASLLAERGARVAAVDLVPRFVERARERSGGRVRPTAGNLLDVLEGAGADAFDVVVLAGVLGDYSTAEQAVLLKRLFGAGVPRVLLAFRTADAGRGFARLLWGLSGPPGLDSVSLFRWIHTSTPYRQARVEILRLRSYRVQLSELVLEEG